MAYRPFFFSVSSVLSGLAKGLGLEAKLLEVQLSRHWPEIVGEQMAAHTRPDTIRFKKLYLLVENSVWLQQLTFLKPQLIEKINAAAGRALVADIVMRVGDVRVPSEEANVRTLDVAAPEGCAATEPSAEVRREAAACAETVTDPALRARLEAVVAKALSSPPGPPGQQDRPAPQSSRRSPDP
jgi:hypothetical protein